MSGMFLGRSSTDQSSAPATATATATINNWDLLVEWPSSESKGFDAALSAETDAAAISSGSSINGGVERERLKAMAFVSCILCH